MTVRVNERGKRLGSFDRLALLGVEEISVL
jgi:hypothetical protein